MEKTKLKYKIIITLYNYKFMHKKILKVKHTKISTAFCLVGEPVAYFSMAYFFTSLCSLDCI